jgi:DNA recombination protein RmuC
VTVPAIAMSFLALVAVVGAMVAVSSARRERLAAADELRRTGEALLAQVNTVVTGERRVGTAELDGRKALLDQQLGHIGSQLAEFRSTVASLDGRTHEQLGRLSATVAGLSRTTDQLRDVLANSKARGQWGERMADDVLRLAGFVEGINYHKQRALASGSIPDFTFTMPGGMQLHMDVKFPLDNYVRCLDATTDTERDRYQRAFLADVRARVLELVGRGYLTDRDHTVDCLLLFVPNEQVLGFVQEHDDALLEEALGRRIVICSPLTLFAVLRVVHQAVDNFRLERQTDEILGLLSQFEVQWEKFSDKLDKLSRSFATVQRDLDDLTTTRSRALQRPLDKIATLRRSDPTLDAAPGTMIEVR